MTVNRHDILIAFDVTNGNPNGDPDAGNMPRTEPNSGKGLVSDVCLKRKVRNFVSMFPPLESDDKPGGNRFGIFVQQGAVLNAIIRGAEKYAAEQPDDPPTVTKSEAKKGKGNKQDKDDVAKRATKWLCESYFDIRTFGAVLSTGEKGDPLAGSAYGQVRGPIQFTPGMSVDPINTQEITLTRCAVTKEEDATKERTMGHKHIVPYGLYMAKAFVSPLFADKTGFDDDDLRLFFDALTHLFSNDQSAARAEMAVRVVYAFEHVGTQPAANAGQNRREQQLGCAHSHKLFESVVIKKKDIATTFPTGFGDYSISLTGWVPTDEPQKMTSPAFPGVILHRLVG